MTSGLILYCLNLLNQWIISIPMPIVKYLIKALVTFEDTLANGRLGLDTLISVMCSTCEISIGYIVLWAKPL